MYGIILVSLMEYVRTISVGDRRRWTEMVDCLYYLFLFLFQKCFCVSQKLLFWSVLINLNSSLSVFSILISFIHSVFYFYFLFFVLTSFGQCGFGTLILLSLDLQCGRGWPLFVRDWIYSIFNYLNGPNFQLKVSTSIIILSQLQVNL